MFHHLAPGSAFFLPHGAVVYNKLIEFMRNELRIRRYQEVISPNLFDARLWKSK